MHVYDYIMGSWGGKNLLCYSFMSDKHSIQRNEVMIRSPSCNFAQNSIYLTPKHVFQAVARKEKHTYDSERFI